MKNFKKLRVRQKGIQIAGKCFQLVQTFPREEKFGLSIQLTRAAVSIPSNLAEGSSRSSVKDQRRFVQIALGSSIELETQLIIAETANFGEKLLRDKLLMDITNSQRMISGYLEVLV